MWRKIHLVFEILVTVGTIVLSIEKLIRLSKVTTELKEISA